MVRLRGTRRSPAFTAAAVFTLGIGLAAATVMFSVLDTVVLRPLTFAGAPRAYSNRPPPSR